MTHCVRLCQLVSSCVKMSIPIGKRYSVSNARKILCRNDRLCQTCVKLVSCLCQICVVVSSLCHCVKFVSSCACRVLYPSTVIRGMLGLFEAQRHNLKLSVVSESCRGLLRGKPSKKAQSI